MKKAFIKGYKAARNGAGGGSNPYRNSPQLENWDKGWITAFIDEEIYGKAKRRIPKSF